MKETNHNGQRSHSLIVTEYPTKWFMPKYDIQSNKLSSLEITKQKHTTEGLALHQTTIINPTKLPNTNKNDYCIICS